MQQSPLAQVKQRFGSKSKLVEAVRKLANDDLWIDEVNDDKGLALVSNHKLLHLHDVLSAVKEEHGSRDKLIGAILEAENRSKDTSYREELEVHPTPRLWDHYQAAKHRQTTGKKPRRKKPLPRKKSKARARPGAPPRA